MSKYIIVSKRIWNKKNYSNLSKRFFFSKEINQRIINKINPKIIFFIHWSKKISKNIYLKNLCIQFHASDLPKFRGGSPVQNQILSNIKNTKLTAFAIGATFGGFAGAFFATRQAFVSPESFTFIESAIIVAIVVLGGMGSQTGVVLAAIFLIGITEIFRDLEQYRMIAFGGAMVLIMIFKPKGILANRKPTVTLKDHIK